MSRNGSKDHVVDLNLDILPAEHRTTASELAASLKDKSNVINHRHLLVDVRNEQEFLMCRIDGAVNFPIDKLDRSFTELVDKIKQVDEVTFICRRGNDSQVVAKKVLDSIEIEHHRKINDLVEGLHAWSKYVDNNFPIY